MAKTHFKATASKDLEMFKNPLATKCDFCGLKYDDFDTGEDFQSVYDQLWSGSADPTDWLQKTRHTVLGRWHEIKKEMWRDHLDQCEEAGGSPSTDEPIEYEEIIEY